MAYVGKITDDDGVTGLVGSTLYGTCATAAGTAAKVVTLADFDELMTGITIHVKFTNANTASSPTLNVNSTGAKAIYRNGVAVGSGAWQAGQVVSFTYTGSQWETNESGHVVVQSSSTTANYRPIMLGYTNTTTIADLAATTINQVYATTNMFAQPSTGKIFAKEFDALNASNTVNATLHSGGLWLKSYIEGANATYNYNETVLRTYAGKLHSNNGMLITLQGGGLTIIGGGESATSLANLIDNDQSTDTTETPTAKLDVGGTLGTKLVGDSENLLLSSDNNIYFITACQTIANRKPVVLDTSSYFYPGTTNTGSIGTSTYKWGNGYFNTINIGTANITTLNATKSNGIAKVGYVAFPEDGTLLYNEGGSSVTGAIVITTPFSKTVHSVMLKFTVDIYDYQSNKSIEYKVAGYAYNDGKWYCVTAHNVAAPLYGQQGTDSSETGYEDLAVRFGYVTNGNYQIQIGETTTVWKWPNIVIRDILVGHVRATEADIPNVKSGWSIAIQSSGDIANVTQTISHTRPYYPTTTVSGSVDADSYLKYDGIIRWNTTTGTNMPTTNYGLLICKAGPAVQVFIPDNASGMYFRRKASTSGATPTAWWGFTGTAGNTYNLDNFITSYTDEKVKITTLAASTAAATYMPTFVAAAGTSGVNVMSAIKYGHNPGTTSAVGNSRLILGNATAEGSANNEQGLLRIYSAGTAYHTLYGMKTNTNIEHALPTVGGTLINSGCVGTGLTWDSTNNALKHSNSVTAVSTAALLKVKYDAQGHITGSTAAAKADIPGLSDYLPLAGGTMDASAEITIPRGATTDKGKVASTGMYFRVGANAWTRGLTFFSDDFSTQIGGLGVYGTQNATTPSYMYFGKTYNNAWYRFYKTSCLISDADNAGFEFQYKPANLDAGYSGSFIQLKPAETFGYGIIIGRRHGGLTMIGAGESANGLCNVIENSLNPWSSSTFGYGSENLFNISDVSIYFISGANNLSTSKYTDWTDIKTALFDNNGYFRPSKDKNGQIGASNYRWNYGYFDTVDANTVNITNSAFGPLTITRSGATYGAGIVFKNSNGSLGSIGMTGSADGGLLRWSASGATTYTVCDTGNMNKIIPSTKYAFVYDNSSDFASYAWHKFAEVTVADANADATATFLVSKTWGNTPLVTGILSAHIRTGGTKVYNAAQFRWIITNGEGGIDPNEFVMVYTNTASTSCKVELWHKQTERYDGWVFKLLKEHSRQNYGEYPWTLYTYSSSTHGLAAYTTGTGEIVSTLNSIANPALSANKISTDAGSNVTPVYFSSGIPVAVKKPTSGAWFSTVPSVGTTGVIDIGRYIDFHSTDAGTTDYDVRLDASSTSLLTLSSNSGTPAFRIAGTLPRLRFTQTTTGKSYDNAGVGIWCQPADTSGVNMFMQSHGNMMISSGEFCTNAYARKDSTGQTQVGYDNIVGSTSENLYLGSDGEVQIISNGQNINTYSNNNHKVWTFGTDGTLTTPGTIKDSLDNQHTMIQQNLRSSSNCVALTWWMVDGAASATTRPGIYYHNLGGDSTDKGAIILQPYHSSSNPWDSGHPIGLYIGKGILQLDGVDVSLSTHTHETLTCKSVDATTVNNTAGCFFFKGNNLIGGINDWVGIQADAANDKFQLVANGASLMYRQNDTGGTNSANWTDWVGLLSPSRVTTDTYLSVDVTTSTLGSGTTAFTFNSGVKISHKAYTAQSSGLYKITVDAAGHVSAATALTITPTPSSKTHTNWDTSAERAYLVTKGWMSYWNGAYNSSNASNLTYCNKGAFGTIVTKSDTDYVPNTTDGVNAAINLLTTGTSIPASDDDYFISQSAGGGTTTTTYHRRPIVKLWQYMVDRSIAFYYNGTADFADAPWAKVVSLKCASASSYRHIAFLVSKIHYNSTDKYSWGILCVKFATNSSKNYDTTAGVGACEWLVAHGNIATTDFKFMYTNTGTTSTTVDIWCKAGHRYASYVFKVLNDTMRGLSGAAYVGTSNIELFSVNGAGVAETDVTGTEITQTLTTIANTSARANTVSGTLTNPTSATQYAIPFHSSTSTGAKTLRNNNGLQYKTLEGTASAEGYSALMLGNSTATGTAANKYGFLRLYSRNTSYVDLVAASTTTARTQTLPSMAGTLCCLNKNSTSYWGLYDGDASGTAWLRTTSNGFIPYASGAFTATTTTALGTDSWWFNKAYIREIQTGVIKFRSGNTESNTTRSYLQLQQGLTGNYDWRLPPASGEVMIRKGSVTAGASQAILYSGTTSGWGHQSVEVFNIFKNWSLIVVNFMGGGYGYSSTDKHSFSSVVPLDFVKSKGTSPTEPYFIPVPANGTNVDATELIECIYVDDSTIEFNRSGASGGIGKITIWGIY